MNEPAVYSDQLKLLFEYTKFHIGLYTTLVTAILGILRFRHAAWTSFRWCLVCMLGMFLMAGLCGGIIASNIPDFVKYDDFKSAGINVLGKSLSRPTYDTLIHLEHLFFWAGILAAVFGVLASKPEATLKAAHPVREVPEGSKTLVKHQRTNQETKNENGEAKTPLSP